MMNRNFFLAMMADIYKGYSWDFSAYGKDTLGKSAAINQMFFTGSSVSESSTPTFLDKMKTGRVGAISHTEKGKDGVYFGQGTTPATRDDYTLESPIVSGITVISPSACSVNSTNTYMEYTSTFGVSVPSGNPAVTISEIGLVGYNFLTTQGVHNVLFDRTVLDNPVTINPGETKQITYTIRFNNPLF